MNGQRRKTENQKRAADRGQWASKTEYLLVVAGNVVGLGNVWRFPYLCYKNGGGAFLVPHGLFAVVCGIPLFLLESSVGQYTQEGYITCWRKLCPLAQGNVVGLGNVWRFPYLCYKNGGGAFLVPYGLFAVVCGISLFLLESSVGQYTQEGYITCWRKLCPLAQGNVVGLGNVWRFPYLCYKNGGGAFLVPYGLFAVVCGIPLFLLESSVGQYTQEGYITCWRKLCPLAQGIGYGQSVIRFYDYSLIIIQAWALFYLVFSFRAQLPWATCENTWNTANCVGPDILDSSSSNLTNLKNTTSAATEFWERRVLGMSGGIEELGSVRWELALCLLASWVFCYFCVWKGVKSSGKVVYFTATFPYVMLLILLVRGLTLPGAWEGIYYYLYPNLNRLANLEVWMEAGSQICFSYSLTVGTLTVLGSHNKYNNNCYKDCFWLCLLNSGTSFVAGFVVFSVLGFMAQKQGVSVDNVVESGPGLAFIAYPQATAMMPFPQFWTICFFLMLIMLSVDTQFVSVEVLITTISDMNPKLRQPGRREMLVLFVCSSFFLIHLLLVTEGGIYIFQLIDYYGMTRACHYFMASSECLALAWIFGADRLIHIIEDMTGQRPSFFFKLCWKYIIPPISLISLVLYVVDYKHLSINDWYVYPDWAYALGSTMTLSSVLMVPLWAAGQMCLTPGTFRQRLSVLCRPAEDPDLQRSDVGDEGTTVELRTSAATT